MNPVLHLDVLLTKTAEGYEAHCLQFDLVEVAPTKQEAEKAMRSVISAHVEFAFAHDNLDHLFHPAPKEVWRSFFASRPYNIERLRVTVEKAFSGLPTTIELQETLLEPRAA